MKRLLVLTMFLLIAMSVCNAYAHSGRTDASGGHHDYINGGYHSHDYSFKEIILTLIIIVGIMLIYYWLNR